MTILLIEDEPLIAKQLLKLVRQLEPEATVDGPLGSVQAVVEYLQAHRPALIIADIQLSDGVSFEAFRQVNLNVPVIFTTAYDEYAIQAFKLNSIDYLLKPVDSEELRAALAKYHRRQPTGTDFADQFRTLLAQLGGQAPVYKRRFTAHLGRQIVPVAEDQIAYFHRDELIYLFTTDGRKLVTDYRTLDELEELVDPSRFFRANRQFLIRAGLVVSFQSQFSGKLALRLQVPFESVELLISKEKASAFREWLEE
jgi:two-component system, LytTR family, response regulator